MTRRTTVQLFAMVSLVATFGYAVDQGEPEPNAREVPVAGRQNNNPNELDGANGGRFRLREGMKFVDQIGELREAGGRIQFYPDGEPNSLQLLENLALERVTRDLDQSHRKWSVTGIVTEYRGGNYLLLHRAVLKARVSSATGPRT